MRFLRSFLGCRGSSACNVVLLMCYDCGRAQQNGGVAGMVRLFRGFMRLWWPGGVVGLGISSRDERWVEKIAQSSSSSSLSLSFLFPSFLFRDRFSKSSGEVFLRWFRMGSPGDVVYRVWLYRRPGTGRLFLVTVGGKLSPLTGCKTCFALTPCCRHDGML